MLVRLIWITVKGQSGFRGEESREDTGDKLLFGTLSFATSASYIDLRQYVLAPKRSSIAADLWVERKTKNKLDLIVIVQILWKTVNKGLSRIFILNMIFYYFATCKLVSRKALSCFLGQLWTVKSVSCPPPPPFQRLIYNFKAELQQSSMFREKERAQFIDKSLCRLFKNSSLSLCNF